jgi:cytoskeletal protein CcmA (bactofilin family)
MLETAESTANTQKAAGSSASGLASGLKPAIEQATLGATMVVKGELSGSQAFFVDGRVEGSIRFPDHRVTIGRGAVVLATIEAKEVVIMGTVTGNVDCGDRVDIRGEAVLTGDVLTQRISIDEGALVKGSVEVRKLRKGDQRFEEVKVKVEPPKPEAQSKPVASATSADAAKAAAAPGAGQRAGLRIFGSKVLYEEQK